MAHIINPVHVKDQGNNRTMFNGIYWTMTGASGLTHVHLKTNIPRNSNIMYYIELEGYNYGASASVDSVWTGYPFSGTGNNHSESYTNWATGMTALPSYWSTDNYVTLLASVPSSYYLGFVVNAVMANPNGIGFEVQILASAINTTSGNYF